MRKADYVDLTKDYVDRQVRLRELGYRDKNISNADLLANVFVLVMLVGWCAYLLME
jgi:hypothetical protein